MTNSSKKYDANFTAGGLLENEFLAIEEILSSEDYEQKIRSEIEENKFIGIKTKSARKRIIYEILRRTKAAPKGFWGYFSNLRSNEKKLALFYLCLKTYLVVYDIHFEVALKKYRIGGKLTDYEVKMRLDELASLYEHIEKWSDSTHRKINIQYRNVLTEAGLLKDGHLIKSNIQNPDFWNYYGSVGDQWFLEACFKDI